VMSAAPLMLPLKKTVLQAGAEFSRTRTRKCFSGLHLQDSNGSCRPFKPALCGVEWCFRAFRMPFVCWMTSCIFLLHRDRSRNIC
jgi:hypothetical protein